MKAPQVSENNLLQLGKITQKVEIEDISFVIDVLDLHLNTRTSFYYN